MKKYESPKFDFQELKLFERVADTCWGTASIWLDLNGDSMITPKVDINISTTGGCQGSWSAGALKGVIDQFNELVDAYYSKDMDSDVFKTDYPGLTDYLNQNPNTVIDKITAEPAPNWANTKAESGGGIIIGHS